MQQKRKTVVKFIICFLDFGTSDASKRRVEGKIILHFSSVMPMKDARGWCLRFPDIKSIINDQTHR